MLKTIMLLCFLYSGTFARSQNVGIGITTPRARLHVADSSVVFSAAGLALANPGNPPVSGAGRRMMWYADKGAFRVGYTGGDSWDQIQVGKYSFASGYNNVASGEHSIAMGLNNNSTGLGSVALGINAFANTDYSVAIGSVCFATGFSSTVLGTQVTASGRFASALGYNNVSKALGGTVVGMFNDFSDTPNPNDTASTDRIFQVGNGYYDETIDDEVRKNAITVLRNGNTGIGTATPAPSALVDISSTTKGFLPPRMNTSQRNAIVSPGIGLTIYNTSTKGVEVYNGTAWASFVHFIGESYGGGIVFYVYDNGQHGLVAAPADLNAGVAIKWFCCVYLNTYAKSNGVGGGLKNTSQIAVALSQLSGTGSNAATICNDYSPAVGGVTYGDWYLPSRHELNLLYLQKTVVGGFANSTYWSSTEFDNVYTWQQNFGTSSQTIADKNTTCLVRAVRAF
ncbi:MAG: hypothetical protein V4722_26605 [Bacteroidota bacterium]